MKPLIKLWQASWKTLLIFTLTVVVPSLYPLLATTNTTPFNRYTFQGMVVDTNGAPVSGVDVYIVEKGRYSLDSAWAVVQIENDFNNDIPYSTTTSGGLFVMSAAILTSNHVADSVAAMVDRPRVFGPFQKAVDSLGKAATEKSVEPNNNGCSCTPTSSIVTYNGKEFVWSNYRVVVR